MTEVKPATKAEIKDWRCKYKAMDGFYGAILSREVGPLIARIDAERAEIRRLRAEISEKDSIIASQRREADEVQGRHAAYIVDAHRAGIEAAAARAAALKEALRSFIAAHEFAGAESWDCTGETRQRFEHAASTARLLLEEPTNGR